MDKKVLKEYADIKRERDDVKRRIRQTEKELAKYDDRYQVQDSVSGGAGGNQHYTIKGFPYPEYERKRSLLMARKLRLEKLEKKLDETMEEVEQFIDSLEDSRKRLILRYRYMDELSWRAIAKKMGPGNNEDTIRMEIRRFLKER